jgi:hypothetical protein
MQSKKKKKIKMMSEIKASLIKLLQDKVMDNTFKIHILLLIYVFVFIFLFRSLSFFLFVIPLYIYIYIIEFDMFSFPLTVYFTDIIKKKIFIDILL